MSCTIWKQEGRGKFTGIYCKNREGAAEKLVKSYNSEEKAEELISLGHIESLGDDITSTVAFCRDKGEMMRVFRSYSIDDVKKAMNLYGEGYFWIPMTNCWHAGPSHKDLLLVTKLQGDIYK